MPCTHVCACVCALPCRLSLHRQQQHLSGGDTCSPRPATRTTVNGGGGQGEGPQRYQHQAVSQQSSPPVCSSAACSSAASSPPRCCRPPTSQWQAKGGHIRAGQCTRRRAIGATLQSRNGKCAWIRCSTQALPLPLTQPHTIRPLPPAGACQACACIACPAPTSPKAKANQRGPAARRLHGW